MYTRNLVCSALRYEVQFVEVLSEAHRLGLLVLALTLRQPLPLTGDRAEVVVFAGALRGAHPAQHHARIAAIDGIPVVRVAIRVRGRVVVGVHASVDLLGLLGVANVVRVGGCVVLAAQGGQARSIPWPPHLPVLARGLDAGGDQAHGGLEQLAVVQGPAVLVEAPVQPHRRVLGRDRIGAVPFCRKYSREKKKQLINNGEEKSKAKERGNYIITEGNVRR